MGLSFAGLHDLSKAERDKVFADAMARVEAASREMAAEFKAHEAAARDAPPDPHAGCYWAYREDRLACVLVVKHWKPRAGAKSFAVSRDGGKARPLYLPFSIVNQGLAESTDDFLLALVSQVWVDRIEKKNFYAAQPLRELFGITLPLTASREWTDEQIATWENLGKVRDRMNRRIDSAIRPNRYKRSIMTRNDAA